MKNKSYHYFSLINKESDVFNKMANLLSKMVTYP